MRRRRDIIITMTLVAAVSTAFATLALTLSSPLPPAERVELAKQRTSKAIQSRLKELGIPNPPASVFLRAYKEERELELWVAGKKGEPMKLFRTYEIAGASGGSGPKRKEGDRQVPEGCYHVVLFNPASRFHLSLRVNYPNAVDKVHSDPQRPGSDIMVHGDVRSIGCLAMTDEKIEEIYTLTYAASKGRRFPIHIFPARLTSSKLAALKRAHPNQPQWHELWDDLSVIDAQFEKTKQVPNVRMTRGRYRL